MSEVKEMVCRICLRPFVVVKNHDGERKAYGFYRVSGPRLEAVHVGEEEGRPVVTVKPGTLSHYRQRLHERCQARREQAA